MLNEDFFNKEDVQCLENPSEKKIFIQQLKAIFYNHANLYR